MIKILDVYGYDPRPNPRPSIQLNNFPQMRELCKVLSMFVPSESPNMTLKKTHPFSSFQLSLPVQVIRHELLGAVFL